jgi:hypothetical protein
MPFWRSWIATGNRVLSDSITRAPYRYQATILFHAPLEAVASVTPPTAGRLEARDEDSCFCYTGAEALDTIAVYLALKGFEFEVVDPPELKEHVAALAARLARASREPAGAVRQLS